jgi:LuxR family transcriptional regulator, maltose regulon positive regulatory protein
MTTWSERLRPGNGSASSATYLPDFPAQEIAGEPFVSVNTVRTHMRHLYTKLDVHTRAEAVERARTLGLLAPSRGTR